MTVGMKVSGPLELTASRLICYFQHTVQIQQNPLFTTVSYLRSIKLQQHKQGPKQIQCSVKQFFCFQNQILRLNCILTVVSHLLVQCFCYAEANAQKNSLVCKCLTEARVSHLLELRPLYVMQFLIKMDLDFTNLEVWQGKHDFVPIQHNAYRKNGMMAVIVLCC